MKPDRSGASARCRDCTLPSCDQIATMIVIQSADIIQEKAASSVVKDIQITFYQTVTKYDEYVPKFWSLKKIQILNSL